jgi:hypothetical protein
MKNERTNWSSPKTNLISGINDLRKCLAFGYKAKLIRILNEDCQHPIQLDKDKLSKDFREYVFAYGTVTTKAEINADKAMSEFEKYLSLNYKICYGTEEAVEKYYATGILSSGNILTMGRSHLVKVSDFIDFLNKSKDKFDLDYLDYAKQFYHYTDLTDDRHFYDYFRLKNAQERTAKHFKHKLWAIEMCGKDEEIIKPKVMIRVIMTVINILLTPLKFIPERRVLIMPDYKWINYRVGDVTNGYSIDIHVPNKFSFKRNSK